MDDYSLQGGQIVSIRLTNFMAYDYVELKPGFNLNVVIGANGTGKSTFVSAVILGLGGKLKSAGRGDNLASFVKNGCKEAKIEIELHEPYHKNVVVTRKITSTNHSQMFINGKPCNLSAVADVRSEYNINVDSFCTFLPQEKVQDFSKLSPQQLLQETQLTIGCKQMANLFNNLKELRTQLNNEMMMYESLAEREEEEKKKNGRIKHKVKTFLENRALCDKLSIIKQKRSWLIYFDEVEKMNYINHDLNYALEEVRDRKYKCEGVNVGEREFENLIVEHTGNEKTEKEHWTRRKKQLEEELSQLRKLIELIEGFDNVIDSKISEEQDKRRILGQLRETLDKLHNDLETFVKVNGTDDDIKAKQKVVSADLSTAEQEEAKMIDQKVHIEDELDRIKKELKTISIEYRLLEKRRTFRLEYLKRYEPEIYKSVEWLKEHKHLFKGRIFNPMLLELDVTESKFSKYVEARVAFRDLISFTCTNPDDLNLLVQKIRTELKLKINAVYSPEGDNTEYRPEIPLSEITQYGFYAYLKDVLIGPKEIIQYLCKVYKIHLIPIGDELIRMKCWRLPNSIQLFFSANQMFSVKHSVYSGEKSVNVKQLTSGKIFSVLLSNERIKKIIERERELLTQSEEKEMKLKLAKHFVKNLSEKHEGLRANKRSLETLLSEKEKIKRKIRRTETSITEMEDSLEDPQLIREELEKEREGVKREIQNRAVVAKFTSHELLKHLSAIHSSRVRCKIFKVRKIELDDKRNLMKRELVDLEETARRLTENKRVSEKTCYRAKEDAKRLTGGLSPGEPGFQQFENIFVTMSNTVSDLEADIGKIQAIAEFMTGGDAELLREYEEREQELDILADQVAAAKSNYERTKLEIEEKREHWIVPITNLVSKVNDTFSNFFKTMGCVGEVCLISGEDEDDFERYGIEIRVKFRDEVPLRPLSRHFQSGGERALATAVYLLSLQELITVPFRFVDEINQGMDPENEKRIMDLMIRVTSDKNSTQYFFMTPKILPNIECSDSMVVHCVYNGPMSMRSAQWNLDSILSKD